MNIIFGAGIVNPRGESAEPGRQFPQSRIGGERRNSMRGQFSIDGRNFYAPRRFLDFLPGGRAGRTLFSASVYPYGGCRPIHWMGIDRARGVEPDTIRAWRECFAVESFYTHFRTPGVSLVRYRLPRHVRFRPLHSARAPCPDGDAQGVPVSDRLRRGDPAADPPIRSRVQAPG